MTTEADIVENKGPAETSNATERVSHTAERRTSGYATMCNPSTWLPRMLDTTLSSLEFIGR